MTSKEEWDSRTREIMESWFKERWKADHWAASAGSMWRAAEILFSTYDSSMGSDGEPINIEDMQMDRPATLLYGYAVENAIKGVLVKMHNLDSSNWSDKIKAWKKEWTQHDLVGLFRRTEVPTSEECDLLLRTLTAQIVWAGKYPTAFRSGTNRGHNGFVLSEQYHSGQNMPPRTLDRSMRRKLDSLLRDLLDKIGDGKSRPRLKPSRGSG